MWGEEPSGNSNSSDFSAGVLRGEIAAFRAAFKDLSVCRIGIS